MSDTPSRRRVELFVRNDLPTPSRERRTAVEDRLAQLQCDGVIDGYETTVWDKRVPVDGASGTLERSRYNEFAAWAADAGVCLAPFFDTRECYSWTTCEKQTELVLPALCLAVYEGDELTQVAPYARGGTPISIEDCLDDLEAGRTEIPAETTVFSTAD